MLAERAYVYYPDFMPFAIVAQCFVDGHRDHGHEAMLAENLAVLINRAADLVARIEDNPVLFFGMEDTCQDEFEDVAAALVAIGSRAAA